MARQGENVGGNLSGRWRCHELSDRPRPGQRPGGRVSAPPPNFQTSPLSSTPSLGSLHVHVEVQHQEFGFLRAVTAAHRADQFGVGGADPPDHPSAAPALQRHQVTNELARPQVPQLHRTVVGAGDDKILVELQARYCALVFVGT